MSLIWIIPFLTFLFVLLGSVAVYIVIKKRETVKVWRRYVEGETVGFSPYPSSDENAGLMKELKDRAKNFLQRLGRAIGPKDAADLSGVRRSLTVAGYRKANAATIFFGVKGLTAMVAMGLALLVPPRAYGFPSTPFLVSIYVGAALVGYYLPNLWLNWMTTRRKRKIVEAFPDALDLLVICVEAGLGLDAALHRVRDEIKFVHPELSEELTLLTQELRTGLARPEALRNLSRRVEAEEVRSLVALLIQTDRFGTSVAQALRVHSDAMKVNRHLRAEEQAAKLPVKLLFPLICFIFPALFVVIVGPGVIKIMRSLMPALGQP